MEIKLKGLSLNIEKAIKRVKNDLRDDWFQDPLKYEDILTVEYISNKLQNNNGEYKPGKAIHIDIPKQGFISRYSTETNILDRIVYQALVDVIAEYLDKFHSNRIYSHRLSIVRSDEKYFFRYAIEEWKKFLADISSELADNSVLLVTDIANFYENISIRDLKNVLELFEPTDDRKHSYKLSVELLNSTLEAWCEKNTHRGLPQNRDPSSFLSNIFLHPVDDAMIKGSYNYFRYADDIRVVCKTMSEAKKALKYLIIQLRKKGLNVNSQKTKILNYDNLEQRKSIKELLSNADPKIEQIEVFLQSKTARGLQIAVPMLRAKVYGLIEGNNTSNREFRYCINRLERMARNERLVTKVDFSIITNRILNELFDQPWSTDTFARYLSSVNLTVENLEFIKDFLLDDAKNIYEWQNFYIWGVLTRHKYKNDDLIKKARIIVEARADAPSIAGACLYLGSNGTQNDRIFVAETFKHFNDHLTQRFALIAIKDLSYISVIKPHVKDHVLEVYKDSYRILSENYKNVYQLPIESLKEEEIFENLPDDIS